MSTTALVSLSIPSHQTNRISNLTEPFRKWYAKKIGAEYIVINRPTINAFTMHFEKFQMYNMLNHFDRILYMDNDIIIDEECPNLFELVPFDKFGAVYANNEGEFYSEQREDNIIETQIAQGNVDQKGGYYNSGVMIFNKSHQRIFESPHKMLEIFRPQLHDQDLINYRIAKYKTEVFPLDATFNNFRSRSAPAFENAYIKHFAGAKNSKTIYNYIKDFTFNDNELQESFNRAIKIHINSK